MKRFTRLVLGGVVAAQLCFGLEAAAPWTYGCGGQAHDPCKAADPVLPTLTFDDPTISVLALDARLFLLPVLAW